MTPSAVGYAKPSRKILPFTDIRNETMIARYYYLSEIKRLRFDDCLKRLSLTFFISEFHISLIIKKNCNVFDKLCSEKACRSHLKKTYPEFDWD